MLPVHIFTKYIGILTINSLKIRKWPFGFDERIRGYRPSGQHMMSVDDGPASSEQMAMAIEPWNNRRLSPRPGKTP